MTGSREGKQTGVGASLGAAIGMTLVVTGCLGIAGETIRYSEPGDYVRVSDIKNLAVREEQISVGAPAEIEKDLMRRFRKENYHFKELVVVPLTEPLVTFMVKGDLLKQGDSPEIAEEKNAKMLDLYVKQRSCFDAFLSSFGIDPSKDESGNLKYYAITIAEIGKEPIPASIYEANNADNSLKHLAFSQLIDKYLPIGWTDEANRSKRGYGNYSRAVVCGNPIDFTKPFFFSVQPRFDPKLKPTTLKWGVPTPPPVEPPPPKQLGTH